MNYNLTGIYRSVRIGLFFFLGFLFFACSTPKKQESYKGLGQESVSPDTLKRFAPGPIDGHLSNKLRKLFDVSAPGMGMLSPDHKSLYFTWKVTGQTHVWMVDGPKRFPRQLTSGQDNVSLSAVAPNGQFLLVSKDEGGKENPGIYKYDLKTNQLQELFKKEKVNAYFAFLTSDSKTMYFLANDQKPENFNIYKMDLEKRTTEIVFEGNGVWSISDYRNEGAELLLYKFRGGRIKEFYKYVPATKTLTPVIGQEENADYFALFAANENEYLVNGIQDDFKKLFVLKDKTLKLISPKDLPWDVERIEIDDLRKRILYTVNRGGYTEIYALNAKTYKPIKIPDFKLPGNLKADHILIGSTTEDSSITMFGLISAQSPRLSYSYNWNTKELTQWVLPSAPEVSLQDFAVTQMMEYTARDGTKIPMFVRFPKNCRDEKGAIKCPAVVHFHGGPEGQSKAGFDIYGQAFVNEGFIFVEPNVRGSDGYGKKWLESDNGANREKVITDIEDVALWIKANWKDQNGLPVKVGAMGWSYGGYSTLMAMTKFAGSFDAGVSLVGMSNLHSFLMNTAPFRRILRISEYGDPEKEKDILLKLSPITYIDQLKHPLMVIQGVNDPRVPVGESIQIHEALTSKGLKSELILFADEGHGSGKKENQILEIGHMLQFLKKHLMASPEVVSK